METLPELYPLTGLQIGDIQSYVSRAFIYSTPISSMLLVLVDNRPWMFNKHSRSAKLWQLMVTKYRMSPFMNSRKQRKSENVGSKSQSNDSYTSNHDRYNRSFRWFPAIDSKKWQEKYLFSVMDLSKALHGFIVFEVVWKDVQGINYLNELQTDTSLALEVKCMRKWEFYSPDQALSCISLWFSGRTSEIQSLKDNLERLSDLDLHNWNSHSSSREILLCKTTSAEALSEGDFLDVQESPSGVDGNSDSINSCSEEDIHNKKTHSLDDSSIGTSGLCEESRPLELKEREDESIEPTQYADTLLLFRFNDSLLPFKLRQTIMSDLRLLTLLESGLPSWVIFFQSYPLFCHFYRPWMRHVARTLYILISLVTVIIGFYDLYKNVPLLKATAARLCGPLFRWIESWDMISRIRYLGTMLFLQNLEKSLKSFMVMVRAIRTILVAVTGPLGEPLSKVFDFISPLWNACVETTELFSSMVWFVIESTYSALLDLIEILLWPFELLYSYIWIIVTSVHTLLAPVRDLFIVPVQCALALANYTVALLSNVDDLLKDVWESASSTFRLRYLSEAKHSASEISIWQGLWNDLFSQVFRATRSVINGLLAFFMTCNRHRLSIYNHCRAHVQYLARLIHLAPCTCQYQQTLNMEHRTKGDCKECDHCK